MLATHRQTIRRIMGRFTIALVLFTLLPGFNARSQGFIQTQTIDLSPGWNAIFLEVDPILSGPKELFAGMPVDVVASLSTASRGAQYVKNPSASMLSAYGWAVWYAPSRSDSFLTSLYSMLGGKAYLIHALTNATMEIAGTISPERLTWTPNAYNFVGFSVASPGAPTFRQFFRGSAAHNHNKIYRLVDGTWRQVLNPGVQSMRAGEAFWIYCQGRSDYPGPLEATTLTRFGVNLSSRGGSEVVLRNRADHPLSFRMEHIVDPAQPIPISVPVKTMDEEAGGLITLHVNFDGGYFEQVFPPLEAKKAISLPLSLRLSDVGPGERHSLLKVTTDLGTISYIPVTASRDDL